jgi:signal transduction histidine kinase
MSPVGARRRRAGERMLGVALAAGALVAVVALAFLVVVLALGRPLDGGERAVLALSMGAAAGAALLYPAARRRAARAGRRVLYAQRPPLDAPLRLFTSRLSRAIPLNELLLQTAEALRSALELSGAEIWLDSGGGLERTVSDPDRGRGVLPLSDAQRQVVAREGIVGEGFLKVWLGPLVEGRAPSAVRVAPVVHTGELLGLILVERQAAARAFGEREEEMLGALARQVGVALHNARLDSALQATLDELRRQAEELRASRKRIVAGADAERRRIERDLHDGAQQRLVSLMVRVSEARELARSGSQGTVAVLDELETELHAALDDLRELSQGVYPPLLSDEGLGEALAAAAGRAALPCRVQADGIGRYAADVETAVYFCCLEALQNAAKHAGEGARAAVLLREQEAQLLFEVRDDGKGFDPGPPPRRGVGLTSMSDRLGAVGGQVRIDSAPGGGVVVRGVVPVQASSDK